MRPPALAAAAGAFDEVLYYHRDYQGSVIGTSRRGAGVDGLAGAKYRYTPYGQLDRVEGVTAWTDSELGYTGGLRLGWVAGAVTSLATPQAPGLVLLGARVYHAELKRWLVPDTVDPLRYTYTGGDPVNRIDPSGRIWLEYDKHKYGDPPPRLAEDFFIEQTNQYATAGFNPNANGSSSGAAQGAGNQAPVPQVNDDRLTLTMPTLQVPAETPLRLVDESLTLNSEQCILVVLPFGEAGTVPSSSQGPHGPMNMARDVVPATGSAYAADVLSPLGGVATYGEIATTNGAIGYVNVSGETVLGRVTFSNYHVFPKGNAVASLEVTAGALLGWLADKDSQGTLPNGSPASTGPHNHWFGTIQRSPTVPSRKIDTERVRQTGVLCPSFVFP